MLTIFYDLSIYSRNLCICRFFELAHLDYQILF